MEKSTNTRTMAMAILLIKRFLPNEISGQRLYEPQTNPREKADREKLKRLWEKEKYGY